jgi:F-box protein 9
VSMYHSHFILILAHIVSRRAGLSENVWISVSHLITYHRYLRFFPSGAVLSLLANEDAKPQELVHQLRPGLRMKVCSPQKTLSRSRFSSKPRLGFHAGKMVVGWNDGLRHRTPGSSRPVVKVFVQDGATTEIKTNRKASAFHTFARQRLSWAIRWNKLDLDDYLSVSQDTGEEVPFPLTHERPFWFSKVRSY